MTHPLRDVARSIASGDKAHASQTLQRLLDEVEADTGPEAMQVKVFGGAMANTLSDDVRRQANLYLRDFDVPQIQLFDLLAHVPLVGLARAVANRLLVQAMRGHDQVLVVDIGIGSGTQEAALIEELGRFPDAPRAVTFLGIEVQAESLDVAERHLAEAGARAGIQVTLRKRPGAAEDVTEAEWAALADEGTPIVAMSSFALHHVGASGDAELRDVVLERLAALRPVAFVLTEPDSNHLTSDYLHRFDAAWRHFGAAFAVLDELSDLSESDRCALKASFFGREIHDILGIEAGERSERHEDVQSWWGRLRAAGFAPGAHTVAGLPSSVIHAADAGDHVSIRHGEIGIVAVINAVTV